MQCHLLPPSYRLNSLVAEFEFPTFRISDSPPVRRAPRTVQNGGAGILQLTKSGSHVFPGQFFFAYHSSVTEANPLARTEGSYCQGNGGEVSPPSECVVQSMVPDSVGVLGLLEIVVFKVRSGALRKHEQIYCVIAVKPVCYKLSTDSKIKEAPQVYFSTMSLGEGKLRNRAHI